MYGIQDLDTYLIREGDHGLDGFHEAKVTIRETFGSSSRGLRADGNIWLLFHQDRLRKAVKLIWIKSSRVLDGICVKGSNSNFIT